MRVIKQTDRKIGYAVRLNNVWGIPELGSVKSTVKLLDNENKAVIRIEYAKPINHHAEWRDNQD
jgi:hypothetical protein